MRIYLDTSSLIKLYHTESGTEELDGIFESNQVQEVFVSSLTKVEFNSALWKKVRTKDLIEIEALDLAITTDDLLNSLIEMEEIKNTSKP